MLQRGSHLPVLILAAASPPVLAAAHFDHSVAATGIGLLAVGALALLIALFIYFLPAFVAFKREHPNRVAILVVNFFFGVSVVGWIVSLIWALSSPTVVNVRVTHVSPDQRPPS